MRYEKHHTATPDGTPTTLRRGCLTLAAVWATIVLAMLACMTCTTSCQTAHHISRAEEHRTRMEHTMVQTVRDSIYLDRVQRDSIVIRQAGDTVYVDRWHVRTRDRWREHVRTDTITTTVTDTVTQYYDRVREVPRQLTLWQRFRMGLADGVMFLALIVAVLIVLKRKGKL